MAWYDLFKLWKIATQQDPYSLRQRMRDLRGAGVTSAEVIPDIRQDGSFWGGSRAQVAQLRDSKDFIDLSSTTNRQSRYKEYERLRYIPEIETAMTVFADESCVIGKTMVATPYGYISIKELAETKSPEERFLVYCYDFDKEDYSLGWAYHPRLVKKAPIVKLLMEDGTFLGCTPDHKILTLEGDWVEAGKLVAGDELMPFYRISASTDATQKHFPKILTRYDGWKDERTFIDEWRKGKKDQTKETLVKIMRMAKAELSVKEIEELVGRDKTKSCLNKFGYAISDIKSWNKKYPDRKRILCVHDAGEEDVYDLSVHDHENFATNSCIVHNCQIGDNGHYFDIIANNKEIKDELKFLFFHPKMLDMDHRLWHIAKNLYIKGDEFVELIIDPEEPKTGVLGVQRLPPESMWRIETISGKLVEFQQSKEGPDYQALARVEVTQASATELAQATATRFAPESIVHFKIGDDRPTFYPYGVSLIEAARGPAHQLRLMEDAMLVYRLCLSGNTRVSTLHGWRYIKDLKEGDAVLSFSRKHGLQQSKITNIFNEGVKPVWKVSTKNTEIIGTATHPVFVVREGRYQYISLINIIPNKDCLVNVVREFGAEVPIPDFLRCLGEVVEGDTAKLLGFLTVKKSRIPSKWAKLKNKKKILDIIISYFKIDKKIPAWVYNASLDVRKDYVEGLLRGLRAKRTSKTKRTVVGDSEMLQSIKEIWHGIGLSSENVRCHGEKNEYSLTLFDTPLPPFDTVTDVRFAGEEEVYDITVDHHLHNFIANGIVSSNSRAPERRVFYIDTGNLPPFRAEFMVERLRDQLRKKKTYSTRGEGNGPASPVEERWTAMSQDEDFFIPVRPNSATRVETLPGACLSLDTEIPLLDGRTLSLSDIIKEYEQGKQLWVYSCDPETGKPAPGLVSWAGITRKNTQVVRLTLDNGESIVCTPDHKFPVIGKGFVEAQNLEIGESMIPFNTKMEKVKPIGSMLYEQVYDSLKRKWVFTHRMVFESIKDTKYGEVMCYRPEYKDDFKNVVHHKNFNRFDNSPNNLALMSWRDHKRYHRDHWHITIKNISGALKNYHANLSEDEIVIRNKILSKMSMVLREKLKDESYNRWFKNKQKEGWIKARVERQELHIRRGQKITERNLAFWADEENKQKVFVKQTIVYPQAMFDMFKSMLAAGFKVADIIIKINSNEEIIKEYALANAHIKRKVDFSTGISVDHVKKMVKSYGFTSIRKLRETLSDKRQPTIKNNVITCPKPVFDQFMKLLAAGMTVAEAIDIINADNQLKDLFVSANTNINKSNIKINDGLRPTHIRRILNQYGYKSVEHARREAPLYNHKIVKIEWLEDKIDTGTITVDGNEELHNYHTFAVKAGIFVKNSHLSEVDDALYFRNKLFIALNFPKGYMANEDVSITRMSLSTIDVKFAKLVERLQSSLSRGLLQIATTHLQLRGFPEHLYEDLQIRLTPPSHHREVSEQEVLEARINRVMSLKGSGIMSTVDLLIRYLKIPPQEAKELAARAMLEKIQELKLQVLASNPQLMGVAVPGQGGLEMGADMQGPSPELTGQEGMPGQEGMEGIQPEMGGMQPPGQGLEGAEAQQGSEVQPERTGPETMGEPEQSQAQPLPEPSEEDIRKYDMEIMDYSQEQDEEEIDLGELDEEF